MLWNVLVGHVANQIKQQQTTGGVKMNDATTEQNYLQALLASEEEEDRLDTEHPEDRRVLRGAAPESADLAIVVGHTSRSTGAAAAAPISESEYDWNSAIADKIKAACAQQRIECAIFYRDGVGIAGAYAEVKVVKPRMCAELHFNAFNAQVVGTETLHGTLPQSQTMAEIFHQHILTSLHRPANEDRGLKLRKPGERGGKSLSQLNDIPSILVEPFFGDAASDAKLGHDTEDRYVSAFVSAYQACLARLT